MTLGEAIQISEEELGKHPYHIKMPFYKACKLGIEALKDSRNMRIIGLLPEDYLLPGETKD